jgi:dolichyl-diphosphooligosaccharide--protein glycosyltransferase
LYGVVCGIGYLLGLLTMSTMSVFGLFVAIFALIQSIINHQSGRSTEYLLVLNVVILVVIAVGMLTRGLQNPVSVSTPPPLEYSVFISVCPS